MVFVEFYDKNQIENVVTALFASPRDEGDDPLVDAVPEGVYLFGDGWTVKEACERYRRIFTQRGKDIPFYPVSADRNRIETIVCSLSKVVAEHEYIAIDVTGGDELFLVAAGVVIERYPEKHVQLHRFSIASDAITDTDLDGRWTDDVYREFVLLCRAFVLSFTAVAFRLYSPGVSPVSSNRPFTLVLSEAATSPAAFTAETRNPDTIFSFPDSAEDRSSSKYTVPLIAPG